MMRAFGQEDKELAESIRKEEELANLLFKAPPQPEPEPEPVFEQPVAPEPAPAFTPPIPDSVQQVKNVLDTVVPPSPPSIVTSLANKEIEGIKKTLAEVMKKLGTLSWGGGVLDVPFKYQLERNSFTSTATEFIICVATDAVNSPKVASSINWEEIT